MRSIHDCFTLSNGLKIPCIGFGTWQVQDGQIAKDAVSCAINAGYRHIDTAAIYNNEISVGEAIKEAHVERDDLFITSKLWNTERGYDKTIAAFNESLNKLDLDYLDLYLIHWPNPIQNRNNWAQANAETWRAMEDLYYEGKIKAIGVSNFMSHHLDTLLETARIIPMVNQIKLCPGETQPDVVEYCKDNGIVIEAYSPFGTGSIFNIKEMKELALKYNKSVAQICLRWSLQRGFLPLPKSVTPNRIRENTECFGFIIGEDDMNLIDNVTSTTKFVDPDTLEF